MSGSKRKLQSPHPTNYEVATWNQILASRVSQTKAARTYAYVDKGACDMPATYLSAAFRQLGQ